MSNMIPIELRELKHNLVDRDWDYCPDYKIDKNEAGKVLRGLEKLEQEPKTGHWILKRTFEYLNEYECSMCHKGIRCTESQLINYPYCHCGAKMEVVRE